MRFCTHKNTDLIVSEVDFGFMDDFHYFQKTFNLDDHFDRSFFVYLNKRQIKKAKSKRER